MGIPVKPQMYQASEKGASIRKNEENSGLSDTCFGAYRGDDFPPSPHPEFHYIKIFSNQGVIFNRRSRV
jgi:hypothetical protein